MDNTQAFDLRTILDRFTLRNHHTQGHEHFACNLGIPHIAASQDTVVHETLSLPRRERTKHEDISRFMLLGNRASCPDRALAAEGKNGLEVGMRTHQVERGLARRVDIFSNTIT